MEFACGLRLVIIFRLIPYLFLRVLLTSLSNSFPLSIVISVGHGYRVSQWSSNQLAFMSAVFSPISTISKNPVCTDVQNNQVAIANAFWCCGSHFHLVVLDVSAAKGARTWDHLSVGQSDLSIQSQSHIEPHSRERSSAHRYRDIHIHTVE